MPTELFYGEDLAYVHDQAFGHLARAGGETLLRALARQGFHSGLVVELGSGSGITAQLVTERGYELLGVEVSADLVEIARERAPAACAAIGECFNYAFDERAGDDALPAIFERVHAALEPGGLFLFDIAEPGRERGGPRRHWSEGPGWMLCLEASENQAERMLERRITVFRELDGGYRRSDELHRLRLYDAQAVLEALASAGFDARRLAAYGSAVHFGRGHSGFLATKRG
jgi:SAM-dependent methyltransferase